MGPPVWPPSQRRLCHRASMCFSGNCHTTNTQTIGTQSALRAASKPRGIQSTQHNADHHVRHQQKTRHARPRTRRETTLLASGRPHHCLLRRKLGCLCPISAQQREGEGDPPVGLEERAARFTIRKGKFLHRVDLATARSPSEIHGMDSRVPHDKFAHAPGGSCLPRRSWRAASGRLLGYGHTCEVDDEAFCEMAAESPDVGLLGLLSFGWNYAGC
ncbi:hypothetical protein B0T16DRAFT_409712 [Cercophora newfieldiana]|uniref:Uncharacterized protein n=1 Tax=Cercophora newfieldiana TaxID=92897 RepID=A0AA39YBJ1_9PEZI|nr:hypothetical protein B0T16DRAFT_409712 [Cercophora newfieldiana]